MTWSVLQKKGGGMDSTTKNCSGRLRSFLESIELVLMLAREQTTRIPDVPYEITTMPLTGSVSGEVRVELLDGLIPARDGKHARFFLRAWDRVSAVVVSVAIEKTATMKSVKSVVRRVLKEHFSPVTETVMLAEGVAQVNFQSATVTGSGTDVVVQAVTPEPLPLAEADSAPVGGGVVPGVVVRVPRRPRVAKLAPVVVGRSVTNRAFVTEVLVALRAKAIPRRKSDQLDWLPLHVSREAARKALQDVWGGANTPADIAARGDMLRWLVSKNLLVGIKDHPELGYFLYTKGNEDGQLWLVFEGKIPPGCSPK